MIFVFFSSDVSLAMCFGENNRNLELNVVTSLGRRKPLTAKCNANNCRMTLHKKKELSLAGFATFVGARPHGTFSLGKKSFFSVATSITHSAKRFGVKT
jgi:hypothetical protein